MLKRSLTEDAQEVFRAIALIELGAMARNTSCASSR